MSMNATKVNKYEIKQHSNSTFTLQLCMWNELARGSCISVAKEMSQPWKFTQLWETEKSNRRGTLVSIGIRPEEPGCHLAAEYWSKWFKLPGKVTLRTQSNCTPHCLPVFIHQREYIKHMIPNIRVRRHATSPYKFKSIDSYFNIPLKFNISNLWKALCSLFSSSHCCRQPTW